MITAPLALVLAIISFFLWKLRATSIGAMIVNILLGIAVASTILGPPMINGLESGSNAVFQAISDAAGAR